MKLKSVKIENMHHVIEKEYTFDDVNYLYGQNGAGKSTALQAIQLALLGYIPGTAKQTLAIFRHARSKFMSVTAVLDCNGEDISVCRTFSGTEKSAKSSIEIIPDGYPIESILSELELPIFNFNEFTGMSANKLKDWFIQFLPRTEGDLDWEEELTKELGQNATPGLSDIKKEIFTKIDELSKDGYDGIELVRQLNGCLKTCISFEKGSISRLQSTIQSLVFYDDCEDVDETVVERYNAEIQEIQRLNNELSAYDALKSQRDFIQKSLTEMSSQLTAESYREDSNWLGANDVICEGNKQLRELNKHLDELVNERAEISTQITSKRSIINGKGICPFTKSECQSIAELVESLKKECEELEEKYFENKKLCDEISSNIQTVKANMDSASKTMRHIENTYEKYENVKAQMERLVLPECPTSETSEELANRLNELTAKLSKVLANIKFNQMNETLTKEKYTAELKLSVFKIWEKLTSSSGRLQGELSEKPFRQMEDMMTAHLKNILSDDVRMKFYLSDKANSFSFGLERGSKYIPFDLLSSGEKCLYTLALMICLTEISSSPLKLILIDDLLDHLDDDKASKLFESLSNMDGKVQIILAGVKEVKSKKSNKIVIEVK